MKSLLIARHGNTFDKGDILRRVGKGTDLPLSQSGKAQAIKLGHYLKTHHPEITHVFSSTLQRTIQTATLALDNADMALSPQPLTIFDEIDYGEDEGKPEEEVVARIGKEALEKWDKNAIPPQGWHVEVDQLKQNWLDFSQTLEANSITLVVTSNGIARFAPYILANYSDFLAKHSIKLSTGAISCLSYQQGWQCDYWNARP